MHHQITIWVASFLILSLFGTACSKNGCQKSDSLSDSAEKSKSEKQTKPDWKALYQKADRASRTGRYEEAETAWLKALESKDLTAPEDRLRIMDELGILYGLRGQYNAELQIRRRALDFAREKLSSRRLTIANLLQNIGIAAMNLREFKEAERVFLDALQIKEEELETGHLDVALLYRLLGETYRDMGGFGRRILSIEYFLKNLEILKKTFGPEEVYTVRAIQKFAGEVNSKDAEKYLREALDLTKKHHAGNHKLMADSLFLLGKNLWLQRKYDEAKRILNRSLALFREHAGTISETVAEIYNAQANIAIVEEKPDAAAELHKQALEIRKKIYGDDDPMVAQSLYGLATVAHAKKDFPTYEKLLLRCIAIWSDAYGEGHQFSIATMEDYSTFLKRMGRDKDARQWDQRITRIKAAPTFQIH